MKQYKLKDKKHQVGKHLLRAMQLCFFFLMVGVTTIGAETTYSQSTLLSIRLESVSMEELFSEIEKKSEYIFMYREDIPVNAKVTVNVENATIHQILDKALPSGLDYKVNNRQVVITEKTAKMSTIRTAPQQNKTFTGTVVDAKGEALIGVSIIQKGTTLGTVTDFDGRFSLEVAQGATLEFSYIGFTKATVVVGTQNNIRVVMNEDTQALDEVVVVGYGVQKKVNLTGAVGTIKSDVMEAKAVTNVQDLLSGKSPGLNVTKGSGKPGSGATMNIRGTSTIGDTSGILVIIDGVPGNLYTINPNDVESISVLKDAASAAIYGSRAANGVILITTKRGSDSEELVVEVNSSVGVQYPQHFIDFLGAEDFMNTYNLARKNEGNSPLYTDADFQKYKSGQLKQVKWYEEVLKSSQLISNNHISLSGKSKTIQYNIAGSYDYNSGTVAKNDYNRYIFRPDMTFTPLKWLSLRANVQYTETHLQEPEGGADNYLTEATRISPITQIYNSAGQYLGPGGTPGGHPIAKLAQGGTNNDVYKETLAIFTATITPMKNWNIRPMFSIYSSNRRIHNYTAPVTLYKEDGSIYSQNPLSTQTLYEADIDNMTRIYQVTSDYMFSLGTKHNFSVLAGYSQEYKENNNLWASRKNAAFSGIYVLDAYQEAKDNGTTYDNGVPGHESMQSVFGRVNYDYDGKYMLEVNVRSDGSSRFTDGNRWGVFPSFSAGWNVHRESFMEGLSTYVSRLKLRGSWGILGDALKVGRYETRNLLSFNSKGYGFNGAITATAWSQASFDPNITWEKAEIANIGFDFGTWDNRISVEFDYFNNIRKDILYRAPVPAEYGLTAPYINALKMRNRGFELVVGYNDKFGAVNVNADFNLGYSKNKVLDLYGTGPWISNNTYTDVGTQFQQKYGYEAIGLFQSTDDPDLKKQTNVTAGNIKYKDQNNDGKIDGNDRVILSDKVPYRYGFNLGAQYKGFDISANFYGVFNNERYMSGYEGWAFYISTNARPIHLDSWTPENPNASYPRITTNMTGNDTNYSSYWLRKANYLKLQTLQVGYTLPGHLVSSVGVDRLRVYLSGQNLGIFSNYEGFDPEGSYYPLATIFSFGLQLKF